MTNTSTYTLSACKAIGLSVASIFAQAPTNCIAMDLILLHNIRYVIQALLYDIRSSNRRVCLDGIDGVDLHADNDEGMTTTWEDAS